MNRQLCALSVWFAVLAASLVAQAPTPERPVFDVVSVKPNRSADTAMRIDLAPGGRFVGYNLPLIQFIRAAYTLQLYQIERAPAWAHAERFDVTALAGAAGTGPVVWTPGTYAPLQLMMQAVLAERFRMVGHMEERTGQGYALVQRGNATEKLRRSGAACGNGCGLRNGPGSVEARQVPLRQFAELLSQTTGRVVVDETGLDGSFDFDLTWAPDTAQVVSDAPSLFTALQEQLNLRLEPRRVAIPTLVIDSIQRPDPD